MATPGFNVMSEMSEPKIPERRKGRADRRTRHQDRRDPERLIDDVAPRRNPEVPDRRKGQPAAPARPSSAATLGSNT